MKDNRGASGLGFVTQPLALIFVTSCVAVGAGGTSSAAPSAKAIVEASAVYVGEPFGFQICVSEGAPGQAPDTSGLTNFVVQPMGGTTYSSASMKSVNGSITRTVDNGYSFGYQLAASRDGLLTIPPIPVQVGGQKVQTLPLTVLVKKPTEVRDFKLRMELSKTNCYVGEPLILDIIWSQARPVDGGHFTLPIATSNSFQLFDAPASALSAPSIAVTVNGAAVSAHESTYFLDGRSYRTVRFRKALLPTTAGVCEIAPATVAFELQSSPGSGAGRLTFPGFVPGMMTPNRITAGQRTIIPSNALRLRVQPLPTPCPPNFSGLVGRYEIHTDAHTTQANVGDPINVTIKVSSTGCVDHVRVPRVDKQPALTNDFKTNLDLDSGTTQGSERRFVATLRPLRPGIREIPSAELDFFDPALKRYCVARSDPIPLRVKAAKVLTADDAEGLASRASRQSMRNQTAVWRARLRAACVSVRESMRSSASASWPLWLCIIALAPLACLGVISARRLARRTKADPETLREDQAFAQLSSRLRSIAVEDASLVPEAVVRALKIYLGERLGLNSGALTFRDLKEPLRTRSVDLETISQLGALFEQCEICRYPELSSTVDSSALITECQELASQLEAAIG